jgi:hypothetical protein
MSKEYKREEKERKKERNEGELNKRRGGEEEEGFLTCAENREKSDHESVFSIPY